MTAITVLQLSLIICGTESTNRTEIVWQWTMDPTHICSSESHDMIKIFPSWPFWMRNSDPPWNSASTWCSRSWSGDSDGKMRVISLRLFHRLVFYIFWKKNYTHGASSRPPKIMAKSRIDFNFFVNRIKNTSSSLWARLFNPGGPTSHRTSIEQVFGRKNGSNSWVWPEHLISDSEVSTIGGGTQKGRTYGSPLIYIF